MPLIISSSRGMQRDNIVWNHWHWYRGWKHISAFEKNYITQCSLYVPACAANCASCYTDGICGQCNEGYTVKADKRGCEGKSVSIETVISRSDHSPEVFEGDILGGGGVPCQINQKQNEMYMPVFYFDYICCVGL